MSEQYTVTVSDDVAEALEGFSDERIREELSATLEELGSVSEKQDELRSRRPEPRSEDSEQLSGEDLEQAMRDWLRGERDTDPRL